MATSYVRFFYYGVICRVFINNKLALDLGGVHGPEPGSIDLDNLANQLGLVVGKNYMLKVSNLTC